MDAPSWLIPLLAPLGPYAPFALLAAGFVLRHNGPALAARFPLLALILSAAPAPKPAPAPAPAPPARPADHPLIDELLRRVRERQRAEGEPAPPKP